MKPKATPAPSNAANEANAHASERSEVKSARRTLEMLEFFAARHGPATVSEVADALDYPQSSTSMLLRTLESLGYLIHDTATRSYRPTLRVMLLGTWMHDELFGQASLFSNMEQLRLHTGQAVLVGLRQGIHVRFILSLPSHKPNALQYSVGVMRPVCLSAAGKMLLTRESDREVQRIAQRANAQATSPEQCVNVSALVAEVRACRERGWAESIHYPRAGYANLSMLLPAIAGQPHMGITLGMSVDTLSARKGPLLRALENAVRSLVP